MKDCIWFEEGYCLKGLPGTKCEISACVCYTKITECDDD